MVGLDNTRTIVRESMKKEARKELRNRGSMARKAEKEGMKLMESEARGKTRQRQLESLKKSLELQTQRGKKVLEVLLVSTGMLVFAAATAGAILLERAESCRFPRHELCETFYYQIDIKYPLPEEPSVEYTGGKVTRLIGGKLSALILNQTYGTYRVVADENPEESQIRFEVCNRARTKDQLKRMTRLEAKNVQKTKLGETDWFTEVSLLSTTSGALTLSGGTVTCQRADVVVYVPTTCMFEETVMHVEVQKGNIAVRNMTTNFDTLTFFNENGKIQAEELSGVRINLNTSWGEVQASDVEAHLLFLQARTSGGVVEGKDLTIFSSDNSTSCNSTFAYIPGFPERPEYLQETVICDQQQGKLTLDTRGENVKVVDVSRFGGGHVSHINKPRRENGEGAGSGGAHGGDGTDSSCGGGGGGGRAPRDQLGTTHLRLMACYDFSGTFDIQSDQIEIVQYTAPPRQIVTGNFTVYGEPILVAEPPKNWYRNYTSTSIHRKGEICQMGSGAEYMDLGFVPGNMTLTARTIETGLIRLEIIEPNLSEDEIPSAALLGARLWVCLTAGMVLASLWHMV